MKRHRPDTMRTLWSNFYIVFICWRNHIKLPYRNTSAAFLTKIPSSWSYQKIILVSYYIFFVINIITRQNHCIIISVTTYTINGITGTTEQHIHKFLNGRETKGNEESGERRHDTEAEKQEKPISLQPAMF